MQCVQCRSNNVLHSPEVVLEAPVMSGPLQDRRRVWDARLTPVVCLTCGHVTLSMPERERVGYAEVCFGHGAPAVRSPDGDAEEGEPQDNS